MSKKNFYMLFIALMVICGLATGTAQATYYYVDGDGGDDENDGLSWPTAFATIQKGINSAGNGDTITVKEWTYYENIDFNDANCTLRSTNPNNWEDEVAETIIDANGSGIVVRFDGNEGANSILKGFTVRNGSSYGVYCSGTSPIISNCIIEDTGSNGIYCTGSGCSPTITHNKIRDNSSLGIYAVALSSPTITNNIIHNNGSGVGLIYAGYAELINNTIANNSDFGILCSNSTAPDINSCIIWDNNDELNGCSAIYSCIKDANDANGTGNIIADPCFVDADANNFHLKDYTSPCIDAGNTNSADSTEVDIDNQSRLTDGDGDGNSVVDMGADEIPEICQTCKGDLCGNDSVTIPDLFHLIGLLTVNNNQSIELTDLLYYDCGDYEDDTSNPTITAADVFSLMGDLTTYPDGWDCDD
jgi:parallel beta-helix repeat protein